MRLSGRMLTKEDLDNTNTECASVVANREKIGRSSGLHVNMTDDEE